MAKFCPLFSSSSGNATYIGSGDSSVLIDAGVNAKTLEGALYNIGVDPASLDAIFITHEHGDHKKGLRVFASRYNIKVYATAGTLGSLEADGELVKVDYDEVSETGTEAGGLLVKPFATPHDTVQSCGYCVFTPDGRKITVCTDLGYIPDSVSEAISGSDLILLESNHDIRMLENGPYPYHLKQRIKGKRGHLSNEICAEEAVKLLESGTTRIVLGHLSKENNVPELAYQTTYSSLEMAGAKADSDYILKVAKPVWDGKAIML